MSDAPRDIVCPSCGDGSNLEVVEVIVRHCGVVRMWIDEDGLLYDASGSNRVIDEDSIDIGVFCAACSWETGTTDLPEAALAGRWDAVGRIIEHAAEGIDLARALADLYAAGRGDTAEAADVLAKLAARSATVVPDSLLQGAALDTARTDAMSGAPPADGTDVGDYGANARVVQSLKEAIADEDHGAAVDYLQRLRDGGAGVIADAWKERVDALHVEPPTAATG